MFDNMVTPKAISFLYIVGIIGIVIGSIVTMVTAGAVSKYGGAGAQFLGFDTSNGINMGFSEKILLRVSL